MPKRELDMDVLTAARKRISYVFDHFDAPYVSFSGGKDSTVLLHLAAEQARERGRELGVMIIDLEAQYRMTIEHIHEMLNLYEDVIDPYWICLPISLRNAVSNFQPKWECWNPDKRDDWVRDLPDRECVISDPNHFDWFWRGMEFEEMTPRFAQWYSREKLDGDGVGALTASMVAIRSQESLNRFRTLAMDKASYEGKQWTTWEGDAVYSVYPIYDWTAEDVWTYCGRFDKCYNEIYDRMHQAGLTIHQQRICQPYGDDQRKGLWLYQILEPETWGEIVARVNGANSGALYAQQSGNINGTVRVKRPPHLSWQEYAEFLLESMPPETAEHYKRKISVFLDWWHQRGYENGIPDEADPEKEKAKEAPSWRRICKTLLRNDYWCYELSFSPTKSDAYEKYKELTDKRRKEWTHLPDSMQK